MPYCRRTASGDARLALVFVVIVLCCFGVDGAPELAGLIAAAALLLGSWSDGAWIALVAERHGLGFWRALRELVERAKQAQGWCWASLFRGERDDSPHGSADAGSGSVGLLLWPFAEVRSQGVPPETVSPLPGQGTGAPAVFGPPPSLGGPVREGESADGLPAAGAAGSSPAAGAPGRQRHSVAAAPVNLVPTPLLGADEAVVLKRFECPREAIRRMLESAATPGEFSASLAFEREVIALCRDRQVVLAEIVESERQLAEVLAKDRATRQAAAVELEALRARKRAEVEAARAAIGREQQAAAAAEAARVERVEAPAPAPEYGWYTISGRGTICVRA